MVSHRQPSKSPDCRRGLWRGDGAWKKKPPEGLVGELLCPLTVPSIGFPKSQQSHKLGVPEAALGGEWELPFWQTHLHALPIVISLSRENQRPDGCGLPSHSQGTLSRKNCDCPGSVLCCCLPFFPSYYFVISFAEHTILVTWRMHGLVAVPG